MKEGMRMGITMVGWTGREGLEDPVALELPLKVEENPLSYRRGKGILRIRKITLN